MVHWVPIVYNTEPLYNNNTYLPYIVKRQNLPKAVHKKKATLGETFDHHTYSRQMMCLYSRRGKSSTHKPQNPYSPIKFIRTLTFHGGGIDQIHKSGQSLQLPILDRVENWTSQWRIPIRDMHTSTIEDSLSQLIIYAQKYF